MEELIIGDRTYISSKRAAEITGYAKDYVGQLCREGRVEATLVGRSWYVLEDSIRAHRFGETPKQESAPAETEASWQAAAYVVEEAPLMPAVAPKPPSEEPVMPVAAEPEVGIRDMQEAWRQWFEQRQEPLLETPAVIDAREEAYEAQIATLEPVQPEPVAALAEEPVAAPEPAYEPVTIHRSEDALLPDEERVPISRFHEVYTNTPVRMSREDVTHYQEVVEVAPVQPASPRRARREGSAHGPSGLALRSVLISIIGLSLVVGIIGSGYLDRFMTQRGFQFVALRVLGGAMVIDKTNK